MYAGEERERDGYFVPLSKQISELQLYNTEVVIGGGKLSGKVENKITKKPSHFPLITQLRFFLHFLLLPLF